MHPADIARTLANASGRNITPEMIAADVLDGAPVDADGLMRLDDYVAWMAKATNGSK